MITATQARQRTDENKFSRREALMKEIVRSIETASYWGFYKTKDYWLPINRPNKEDIHYLTAICHFYGYTKVRITKEYFTMSWKG